MDVLKRWMWLVILFLGVAIIGLGVIFIVGGASAKSEMVDGFYRTQIKDENGNYRAMDSAADLEWAADYMRDTKYAMEDARAVEMGILPAGGHFNSTNRLDDRVKYDLYLAFLKGPVTFPGIATGQIVNVNAGSPVITPTGAPTVNANVAYLPQIDGQLIFGIAKTGLGMAKMMTYTGYALLIVGIAVILVAVMILGFTKGFEKVGAGFAELMKGLTGGGGAPK